MKNAFVLCLIIFSIMAEANKTVPKKMSKRYIRKAAQQSIKTTIADKNSLNKTGIRSKIIQGNAINGECKNLENKYHNSFSPLGKEVADQKFEDCVFQQKISDENIHFFVRAAFYHKNDNVKKEAFNKLDSFECGVKVSCQEFYKVIDIHNNGAQQIQKKDRKTYFSRAHLIKEKVLAKINQL